MYTPFDNAVHNLYKMKDVMESQSKMQEVRKACAFCKTEKEDYEDTYFVGCPACYNVFNEEIKKACIGVHGSNKHVGKIPEKYKTMAGKQAEIQRLEAQKQRAVEKEDFELAGMLKNKIAKIKGEIYGY